MANQYACSDVDPVKAIPKPNVTETVEKPAQGGS